MATRLAEAGYQVQGYDVSEDAAKIWTKRGGVPASPTPPAMAEGAEAVILPASRTKAFAICE